MTALPPPGWYRDPLGRFEHRYWSGSHWTGHVGTRGVQSIDPYPAAPPVRTTRQGTPKIANQARKAVVKSAWVGAGTIFTEPVLVINQVARAHGANLSYAVYDQHGNRLGAVDEVHRGIGVKLGEKALGRSASDRRYRLQLVDLYGNILLEMTRPTMRFTIKSAMTIEGPQGVLIGRIAQETHGVAGAFATWAHWTLRRKTGLDRGLDKIGHVRFGLWSNQDRVGTIRAENSEEWDFRIEDDSGREIAKVSKTWAGWMKERFTNADNYVLQIHAPLQEPLRSLTIGAALAIDVARKQGDPTFGTGLDRKYE